MPFTFAHPAAIIPLRRLKKLDIVALTFGAMAPDFDYFLAGRPHEWYGHHWIGMLTLNLWLTLLLTLLYRKYWHEPFVAHLPYFHFSLSAARPLHWMVLSAWIGMATHIVWDAFTHETGYVVTHIPLLTTTFGSLPLYKLLQHGSTLVGFSCLAIFLAVPNKPLTKARVFFWLTALVWSVLFVAVVMYVHPWSLTLYGTTVVRYLNCLLLALLLLCFIKKDEPSR